MSKTSFVLQTKLNNIVAKLSDKQAGVLFKRILNYAANGTLAGFEDDAVGIAFEFVRQDIDYTAERYAQVCAKRAQSGRRGGLAKAANAGKAKQTSANAGKAKHNDNDNDNENDTGTGINTSDSKEKEKKENNNTFSKPTLAAITAYCQERASPVNPQVFFDFYQAKGWLVGKSPMKDWQAALRTWEHKAKQERKNEPVDYNCDVTPGKYAGLGRTFGKE